MALAFIAQSVGSALIGNLVDTCSSYLQACPAANGMQDELDRLHYDLPQVEAVLTAVEEGAPAMMQNEGLRMWLWQLRDAVENAEDVLDELKYYELEKIIRDRDDKVRGNTLSKWKIKIDSFIKGIFPNDTLGRLKEAVKKLNKVIDRMGPFLQVAIGFYGPSIKRQKLEEVKNARETSSLLTESEVFGRDKERDAIVEWLIKPVDGESEGITFNVSAYSIVGIGGLGKTTLAQVIHQDERVQGYFHPIMWVCVSQDFNAAVIIRKMLEVENSGKTLNALHEDLKQKLMSNRFLLILDDVWNDDIKYMTEWEKLVAPLKFGQRGSKILLTTRMGSVADMAARVMQYKRESLDLKELEESDCMSLFNKHAFRGVNPDDYKNLQPIGEQIVKKLGGCPLAIKVMGGLLNSSMDYDYWKGILKEDIQQGKNNIMTVLRLSYDHLPIDLQVCFRYCSIFPQDYEFKRKELVYMWMVSCLIPQSICERQRPEDIGKEYFDLLARKSFFTCKTRKSWDKISRYYVMHDLLHDLAQSVSLGECIRIGGDVVGNTIPRTVRHLSFETINPLSIEKIPNLKNLRTLVLSFKNKWKLHVGKTLNADHEHVLNEVIKRFKNLRLLSLSVNFEYNKLPDALDSLIHLRYLSISSNFTRYESFHFQSLYRLYHLVVMKLSFDRIPPVNIEYDGLTNLVNLRSLDVHDLVILNIPYLSKLRFICKLKIFIVREKSGYKISELKNLRDLHGQLSIRKLENVRSSEEAMEAKLNKKEYLKSLSLHWSRDRSSYVEVDEQLLENLCPHINLRRLSIKGYQGVKSPYWMTDLSLINLTFIQLWDCTGWEHLPPLGALPSLTGLHLRRVHAVKQIGSFYGCGGGCAFPSLKELDFEDMPNLEEWIGIDDCCMFPKLHIIRITKCPNLSGLPTLPCSLSELRISNVGLTAFPAINEDCGNNNQQEQFSALKILIIEQCKKLQYLPTKLFQKFNNLKELRIKYCGKWTTREISNIQQPSILDERSCGDLEVLLLCLANLVSLTISGLHGVKKIDSSFFGSSRGCAFLSLEEVVFENLPNLEEWIGIDDGCMFPKLVTMRITKCPNLMGILTRPRSLRELSIDNAGLTALQVINQDCGNNNQEYFKALESLDIGQCKKLEYIPTLPRSLRELRIYNVGLTALQVINQDCGNNNALESLHIEQCEKLEYVSPEFFWKSNPLRKLNIIECPKLTTRGISDIQLPSTLCNISIGSCGDLEVPLLCLLPNSTSFTWLELYDCASITSLPTAQVCARWTMLSSLIIENCKEFSSLGGIQALISLRSLLIRGCDKLIEVARLEVPFPNDVDQENAADCFLKLGSLSIDHHALLLLEPLRSLSSISDFTLFNALQCTSLSEEWLLQNHSALKKLEIGNAVSLQSLPQSMTQLCSLERLEVGNAKLIRSLPDLPTSLRYLVITECQPELKERCQENIGLDWPKIASIRYVDVRIELKYSEDYYFFGQCESSQDSSD